MEVGKSLEVLYMTNRIKAPNIKGQRIVHLSNGENGLQYDFVAPSYIVACDGYTSQDNMIKIILILSHLLLIRTI